MLSGSVPNAKRDLRVHTEGGILSDVGRVRGKKAKARKKALQTLSREGMRGYRKLDEMLETASAGVHFFGHHHRFQVIAGEGRTPSVGLRGSEVVDGAARPGWFALVRWWHRECFEVWSDAAP